MDTIQPKYKRVLLKLSGEALAKGAEGILNFEIIENIAATVKKCREAGVEMAVLVGAGNIWRGRSGGKMDRVRADNMGMLATTINALAISDTFEQCGIPTTVMTAVEMQRFADAYTTRGAVKALEEGRVVIFGCGSGCPYFSTDTAAVLRAAEIQADMILLAKNIDGVYSADPKKDPNAVKYDSITYDQVLADHLQVMDLTATSLALEHHIPVMIFALADPQNIQRAVMGEKIGTIVEEEKK